jgi:hypothetical protein
MENDDLPEDIISSKEEKIIAVKPSDTEDIEKILYSDEKIVSPLKSNEKYKKYKHIEQTSV